MIANDLRKRAAWLRAISARLPCAEVASTLSGYADEMLDKARRIDGTPALRHMERHRDVQPWRVPTLTMKVVKNARD